MSQTIPFNNLIPLHTRLQQPLEAALQRVLAGGWYILGPEVEAFESAFAAYHGLKHAVGVANGTDAIELALRAASIGAGDEVITVAHTAAATITAIERAGAIPVMVDIDPLTYTMNPQAAAAAITPHTRAILPVHIYGHPADLSTLKALTDQHGLLLIEDCAQAHAARWNGQLVGTFGALASFSFYPTKNLGALGDGGAILTNDDAYAEKLKRLRNYGQTRRYYHDERGINSRLDELQAALLSAKLPDLAACTVMRREIAATYAAALDGVGDLTLPIELPTAQHVYHLYVIRHPRRTDLMTHLAERGIGTLIHYPVPNHLQAAFSDLGCRVGSLPETEKAAREIVSLPLWIGLSAAQVGAVAAAIKAFA
ncbi:MAG TPA: DegT/DnrJ/EryC1/StrS family aminotransferase [Aggregatilineales bacterium]|nr:DegT/DnrJ/EryC1/StrS family aminotransferase [Anaerolineales bacterium]HRE49727.1 DegT/DnrJ/EryC1/StrS family aminotransferase [Aggregatilineales bacterium]